MKNFFDIRICVFIISVLILNSCSKSIETNEIELIDISKHGNNRNISEVININKRIPLETTKESLIGSIFKIIVNNDKIYVVDNKITSSIFIFDNKGRFENKINFRGIDEKKLSIADAIFNRYSNSIEIYDKIEKAIVKYNTSGEQQSYIKTGMPCHNFCALNKNKYAIYSNKLRINDNSLNHDLHYIDKQGDIINSFLSYDPSIYTDGQNNKRISGNHRFAIRQIKEKNYLAEFYNDTIYLLRKQQPIPRYKVKNSNPIPSELNRFPKTDKYFEKINKGNYIHGCHIFYENDDYLFILAVNNFNKPEGVKYYLWNKTTKETILLENSKNNFSYPVCTSNEKIYSFKYPIEMSKEERDKLGVKLDDNPFVIEYNVIL